MLERKITFGVLLALLVQTGSALIWAGAAAERISGLEYQVAQSRPVAERLARVEAELDSMRAQLSRIEDKVDRL